MIWQAGDSGEMLRDAIKGFITQWFNNSDQSYKARLPAKHWHVVKQGEKQPAGVLIVIVTQADPANSWPYEPDDGPDAGKAVLEENHKIALVIKADERAGGVKSVSPVHSALRSLFSCPDGKPERDDLIARGVYNLFDDSEGMEIEPGDNSEQGTFYSQQINLVCSTDTFIK